MRNIYCIDVLKYNINKIRYDVIFKSPFDEISEHTEIKTIDDLKSAINNIQDEILKESLSCRFFFITEYKFTKDVSYRVGRMNWKWDEEYYKNLKPSHSKGADQSDNEMFQY